MQITQRDLDRYRRQVRSRQDDARAYVLARLQAEARGLTVAEAREATIGIMQDCLAVYGDKAQALSAELFDEICEAEGIDAQPGAMFDDVIDSSKLAGKVHYYAGKLVDGDWEGYAGSNADLAAYYVHRSALENMERNCQENRVKYARVGTGRETCGYCFMLSSRGFDYRSEKTASAGSHVNCDCIIVPGRDGVTKIDGYNPKEMRRRWNACEKAIGGEREIKSNFKSLPSERLAAIKGKTRSAKWNRYYKSQIEKECETRNAAWLYRGYVSPVDTSAMPDVGEMNKDERNAYYKDRNCADVLSRNGLSVKMIDNPLEKQKRGVKKYDYKVDGVDYEAKCPTGDGYLAVVGNIAKADMKFRSIGRMSNVVISNLDSKLTDDEFIGFYKESLFDEESDYSNVKNLIFVLKDGSIRRLK